jgi:hypothetical protein
VGSSGRGTVVRVGVGGLLSGGVGIAFGEVEEVDVVSFLSTGGQGKR